MDTHLSQPYKGYSIVSEGHGFYRVLSPANVSIGTCEGAHTGREMIEDHIRKVYGFYERNCDLSPLQARAAHLLTNAEAERMLEQHDYEQMTQGSMSDSDYDARWGNSRGA